MKRVRYWIVYAAACTGWLAANCLMSPSMSGADVFIFRDAGWNLAQWGSFESAGLLYMRGLAPRLYSHYPPLMPLLFAGYASAFPRNAYAGTIFNLLLGMLAAGIVLAAVLRRRPSRLRFIAALAVAALPVAFVTYDRPEALGLSLFCAAIAAASRANPLPLPIGLLVAVVFLAHPFAAVASAAWIAALLFDRNRERSNRWAITLKQLAIAGAAAAAVLAPVALLYYSLDRESLARFAAHSLGINSGLGRAMNPQTQGGFLHLLWFAASNLGFPEPLTYIFSAASGLLLALFALRFRKRLDARDRLIAGAGLLSFFLALALFPVQGNYVVLLTFLVPAGLLIAAGESSVLSNCALALLVWAIAINSVVVAMGYAQRAEQAASYRAAKGQPQFLLTQLPSRDSVVAIEGGSYDLFKSQFHHLIQVDHSDDEGRFAALAAVVNCYDSVRVPAGAVRPFPSKLDAGDFRLIEAAPEHMWFTVLGRRAMRSQWGYGCDLYVRDRSRGTSGESRR